MDDKIRAEERAYWAKEVELRSFDAAASRARSDPSYLVAAADLRLSEAQERLTGLRKSGDSPSAAERSAD